MLKQNYETSAMSRIDSRGLVARFALFCILLLLSLFIYGCGPASKAINRGDELVEMKNYYGASQEYLTALGHEKDNEKAKAKLCQIAGQAYEQQEGIAANAEKSSDYESALRNYRSLSSFLDSAGSYNCVSFPTINVKQKIEEMQGAASEKYYKEAETLFAAADYDGAIGKYEEALRHNKPYKDSTEKIAESYYRNGAALESSGRFRDAAKSFVDASSTVSNYKDSSQRASGIYCALGDYHYSKKAFRTAYNDYCEVSRINPGFQDIDQKIGKAEADAVTKIAFMRFDNPSGRDIAGASVSDMIFDEMQSKLKGKASRFLKIIEREELEGILQEQRLGEAGISDEYATFKKLKGVHYLVFGKLTQVNAVHPQPKAENLRVKGNEAYECTKYNKKGKAYQSTCYQDTIIQFSRVSDSMSLTMSGSMKVLSVSSGENIIPYSISTKKKDSVVYATDLSKDISNISVDDSFKNLVSARRDLAEEDSLMKQIVTEISDVMVDKIIAKIDVTPSVSDPTSLKLSSNR
jgi:tetratricopeptide (TPR) repeat protein